MSERVSLGFSNSSSWESRTLGSLIVKGKAGGTPSANNKSYYTEDESGIPFLGITDMTAQGKYLSETSKRLTSDGLKNSSAWIVPEGYLIFAMSASVGKIGITRQSMATSQAIFAMELNGETDKDFIYYSLEHFRENGLDKLITKGTQGNINAGTLKNIEVLLPSLPEQKQIGEFFSALDERIELQARKVGLLREQKRGYQQRVFNRELVFTDDNGNPYPEWEQATLRPYLTESRIKGTTGDKAQKLTVKLYGKGVVEKKEATAGSVNTQYYVRKSGQLIYGKLDFLNGAFGLVPEALDGYESTLDAPSFDIIGLDPVFLLSLVSRKEFYFNNGNKANGSRKAKRIHPDDFLSMPVSLPSLPEQEKIAEFLSALDENLELNERKLTLLKEEKKGYLQAIFG